MLDFQKLPRFQKQEYQIFNLIDEWAEAYQVTREDIMRQIQLAHAWANANPKRAPKKDAVRFLNSWMGKAKQWNNLVSRPPAKVKEEIPPDDQIMTGDDFKRMREAITRKANPTIEHLRVHSIPATEVK